MSRATGAQELVVKGVNGKLTVTPTKIGLSHPWWSIQGGASGTKEIRIEQITAVQYKPVSLFTRGYLRFSFVGGQESKRGGTYAAVRDENAIVFKRSQQKKFLQAKALIEQYQMALARPSASVAPTLTLEQLTQLREQGIISQEEFQAKSRQLLGL